MNRKLAEALQNSKGQIYYGMHFYPGVAQYDMPEGSFRVFINEATIRKLNPSFAGRPVFVEHVEGVDEDVDTLRNEADGWVIESFFNQADGKTWCKFILVTERAFAAVRKGFRLSNAYLPQLMDKEATWNGVDYQKQVVGGEFEHLAIVNNPRYEESVIMTPDEFKSYNEKLKADLYRLANSNDNKKKGNQMSLKLFQRKKLENAIDIENTMVELPKSKKEMSISQLVNDHDAFLNMQGYANDDHHVKLHDESEMSVGELKKAYQAKCNELDEMHNAGKDDGGEPGGGEEDDIDPERAENDALDIDQNSEREEYGDPSMENEEDSGERDENGDESLDNVEDMAGSSTRELGAKNPVHKNKVKNAAKVAADKKIANAKRKAKNLRNAHLRNNEEQYEETRLDLMEDQIARGKARYGSN